MSENENGNGKGSLKGIQNCKGYDPTKASVVNGSSSGSKIKNGES